ncbi:MAG: rhomboid family intramembrane serine protease, partial [Halobacteriota archaeon]
VQSLWLLVGFTGDDYVLYQGIGVTLVAVLTVLVTVAATGSGRPLVARLSGARWLPTPRQFAVLWLAVVAIVFFGGLVGVALAGEPVALVALVPMALLFAAPALVPLVRGAWAPPRVSRRAAAVACLLVVTVLVALPSLPLGMIVVDDAPTDTGEVVVEGYTVTYERAATSGQQPAIDVGADDLYASEQSGVIVVDPDRQLWTVGVPDYRLEHAGEATVRLGGFGWQESVTADRTGWDVVGSDNAYVVDLTVDGETTRSFTSDSVRADAVVEGHAIELVPTGDAFEVRTLRDGGEVASVPVPDAGTSVAAGDLTVTTEAVDDAERLVITGEDTVVTVAEREAYA